MQQQPPPPPPPAWPPPPPPAGQQLVPPATPGSFDRDVFLLRQKHLSIKEKYYVSDENGQAIFYAERPQHIGRNLLAAFLAVVAAIIVAIALGSAAAATEGTLGTILGIVTLVGALVTLFVVNVALVRKRHVIVYADDSKQNRLLEIQQERKVHIITGAYTVTDGHGTAIARFVKKYLHNIIRRRWECFDASGNELCLAQEDSIGKAIARRLLGPLFGVLRTNFIIVTPQGHQLGEFNREFTILDRYVLDMRQDAGRSLDRRIALALGLMLDPGEKR